MMHAIDKQNMLKVVHVKMLEQTNDQGRIQTDATDA
jgi:hypothetical protein